MKSKKRIPIPEMLSHRSFGAKELDDVYDRGYFFGESSGYPREGYGSNHPDWAPWLGLIALLKPTGIFFDLGCAFGYLPGAARSAGYQAYGVDISSFALNQEPGLAPVLLRARLEELPFRDSCSDVVTLFDVLEHLEDPISALAEAVRLLKPDGLLVGSTPDPIYFHRQEETHCYERPPSFWVAALQQLGLVVRFRFSVQPYNFQFTAAFPATETASRLALFQHDYFAAHTDLITSADPLVAVPRSGWGPLQEGGREIQEKASLYLLNPTEEPLRAALHFRVRHPGRFSTLRVRLGSQVLDETILTSEEEDLSVAFRDLMIPQGGCHLFFELLPPVPDIVVSDLSVTVQSCSRTDLTLTLPFDLFQRYRLAAEITGILAPARLLDIGGLLGDQDGHLATSADFLGATPPENGPFVVSSDLRHADYPAHVPAQAWKQPFQDESFDLVVSLDVLEHLQDLQRSPFLHEMDRLSKHWILLGAPFADPAVETAEVALAETLMSGRPFLQEHRELGLPSLQAVIDFFEGERGYTVTVIASGFLPRWKAMQGLTQLCFRLNNRSIFADFNRLYNRHMYPQDQRRPCYRLLCLIQKEPLTPAQLTWVKALESAESGTSRSMEQAFLSSREFFALEQAVFDAYERKETETHGLLFLLNERRKLIEVLEQQIEARERQLEASRREIEEMPLRKLLRRRLAKKKRS